MPRWFPRLVPVGGLVLLLAGAPPAAAWPPEGLLLSNACCARSDQVVPDGLGGAIIAWQDTRAGGDSEDIYAQRVTAAGEIAPGWPLAGVPVCTEAAIQLLTAVAADGLGGVVVTWSDHRNVVVGGTFVDVYAQRLLADGRLAPGWPVDGAAVTRALGNQNFPVVAGDGAGGAFFSWHDEATLDIYVQHLTAGGEVAPGWPADGLPVCPLPAFQGYPLVIGDGTGGVIVAWGDLRDGPLAAYAQRVLSDGSLAPGWPENGVRIVLDRALRNLVPDGGGGAYLSCATLGDIQDSGYYLQRFTAAGTIAPGWPEGGALVANPAEFSRAGLRMVPDGAGGALLAWYDYRDIFDDEIFLQRMRPDGTLQPGWPVDGLRVTDNTGFDAGPVVAADGLGGAFLAWQRGACNQCQAIVQQVTGAPALAPGWPADGQPVPGEPPTGDPEVIEDGEGGAIVVWEARGRLRALRYVADGPVPVLVSLVSAEAEPGLVRLIWFAADGASLLATVERRTETSDWERLGSISPDGTGRLVYEDRAVTPATRYGYRLSYTDGAALAYTTETWVEVPALRFALRGFTPNPAAGDPVVAFSLASGERATLELFDLRGRLVLSRDVGSLGAGTRSVRLESRGRLPAGVYTVRLRQGEQTAKARAVVIR